MDRHAADKRRGIIIPTVVTEIRMPLEAGSPLRALPATLPSRFEGFRNLRLSIENKKSDNPKFYTRGAL
jgi:hypothetical protein